MIIKNQYYIHSGNFPLILIVCISKTFSFQDVLAEVPRQVAEYMERNRFRPGVPDVAALDFDQMRLSCA